MARDDMPRPQARLSYVYTEMQSPHSTVPRDRFAAYGRWLAMLTGMPAPAFAVSRMRRRR